MLGAIRALAIAGAIYVSPALAQSQAPLGGVVKDLSCEMRAYDRCAGDFCYDSKRGESTGTSGKVGVSSKAFNFNFADNTASVGEEYAKNISRRWPIRIVETSPAVVNKPMFVKFRIATDAGEYSALVVATPIPEGGGYSFGFGVMSPRPYGDQPVAGVDRTINSGDCKPVF
jgi:hypothetical protein